LNYEPGNLPFMKNQLREEVKVGMLFKAKADSMESAFFVI
jgi:hypothetical protein